MNTDVLKLGDRIIIKKKVRKDESEYTSQIQNIDGKNIRILTPMYKSVLIRLQERTIIELLVFGIGKVYYLEAEVGKTIVEGNLYYTDVVAVSEVKKIERRYYFRVKTMKDILVRTKNEEDLGEYVPAITIDLSGGGLMFSSIHSFSKNDIIEIKVDIGDDPMLIEAEVLNRSKQEGSKTYRYTVMFINLDSLVQEKIISHVFKLQRDALQK